MTTDLKKGMMEKMGNQPHTIQKHNTNPLTPVSQDKETRITIADYLDDLLDASFDGIVISDAKGIILKANRAYKQLSGFTNKEIIGHNLEDLVRKKILKGAVAFDVLKTRTPTTQITSYDRTGKEAIVTGNPVFGDHGELIYVVTNFRDVTQLRMLIKSLGLSPNDFLPSEKESFYLKTSLGDLPDFGFLVHNNKMKTCLQKALVVAQVDVPVLILGESGVGKTQLAQIIHKASQRANKPFISINCASIPENLLESELFGYERGAFTGASLHGKAGQLEFASGGTLLLEEIGELPLSLQAKLLQAIEEKQILKVGGKKAQHIDVRIIAITNRDLQRMVMQKQFRNDLYFRLNVLSITIPPLRERLDEIPLFIRHFFAKLNSKYGTAKFPASSFIKTLCEYDYPGNVRELKNIVERLVIMAPENCITPEHFIEFGGNDKHINSFGLNETRSLDCFLQECEKKIIEIAIQEEPTMKQAAERLGISVTTLWRKMRKNKLKNS